MSGHDSGATPMPPLTPRTTTFDRAWRKLATKTCGSGSPWTPRNAARLYLLAERASGEAKNDDALGELGAVSTAQLERIAPARSRNVGDVAAKLAALIVENGHSSPVSSGGIEGTIHAGMCSCLADLVILGDRPLPDASAVLDMRAPDFELRDMTADEIADFQAEADAERARLLAQVAPAAAPDLGSAAADLDPAWPAGLDLRNLHADLEGVIGCLAGLDDLAAAGSEIKPEYLRPALAMLVAWRDRIRAARDAVEAEDDARREAGA